MPTRAVFLSRMAPGSSDPALSSRSYETCFFLKISTTSTTEQQHCLHRNCLHTQSVLSPQLSEVDTHLEEGTCQSATCPCST